MGYTCVRDRTLYEEFHEMCHVIFKREMTELLVHQVKRWMNVAHNPFATQFCHCLDKKEFKAKNI